MMMKNHRPEIRLSILLMVGVNSVVSLFPDKIEREIQMQVLRLVNNL